MANFECRAHVAQGEPVPPVDRLRVQTLSGHFHVAAESYVGLYLPGYTFLGGPGLPTGDAHTRRFEAIHHGKQIGAAIYVRLID